MVLNPYFLNGSTSEQGLLQNLIDEQLKMYGVECYYMPRKYVSKATVIKEVIESKFDDAYPLEAYVDNYEVMVVKELSFQNLEFKNRMILL